MRAISATPEEVKAVFAKKYIIPGFQRPYSWDRKECGKLWDDVINFYEESKGDKDKKERYFLGSIVLSSMRDDSAETWESSEAWEVVDGQQRLTTLLLLIKALHCRAGTYGLSECLQIRNAQTGELTDKLRVVSNAMDDDRVLFEAIILRNEQNAKKKDKILDNYVFFGEMIDKWWQENGQKTEVLEGLITTLLNNIVLLPIRCDSEDDALTLFEIINNRGKLLEDADIFKATLYRNMERNRQSEFKKEWNALKDHDNLFRKLMHILRATAGETGKEIGLRAFFTDKDSNRLGKCDEIMNSLKVIHMIKDWNGDSKINCLWGIMKNYPNQYWEYPLYVFLHKYGKIDPKSDTFVLPQKMRQFTELLEATVRYFFIKGVVYGSVNVVKDTVFRVCAEIEKESDYLSEYSSNIKEDDIEAFASRLGDHKYGRCLHGLVLLSAYLNPRQNKDDFALFLWDKYDLEHILPRKWNHYDGWTNESWREHLDTLGNRIPLLKAINIAAKNEFFDKKKIEYKKSKVQDALDLLKIREWTPYEVDRKQKEKLRRLCSWVGRITED